MRTFHVFGRIGLIVLLAICFFQVRATHIVGGEFAYAYLGDTLDNLSKYSVSVSIYEDCLNGNPEVIAEDNPAFLIVYDNLRTISRDPILLYNDQYISYDSVTRFPTAYYNSFFDSVYYSSNLSVPTGFSNQCITNFPNTCLLKKTFTRIYYLPHNTDGYIITYQRCCRNQAIDNISDPGNTGSTFYCTIPAWPVVNNSAVFKNYPPQIICLDNPLTYDNSARDADGDSLSYEYCVSLNCCGGPSGSSKPVPPPPDQLPPFYYDSISYRYPYSSSQPMPGYPPIVIDSRTGLITGTPNQQGRYLVTICCNEWRHGMIINTSKREFQFVVAPCSKVVVANIPQFSNDPNTYIINCKDYTVNFVNTSKGGFSWLWNFGVPGAAGDVSTDFEPTYTYPDTGTFDVKLVVNPGSTCSDSITRLVKIYPVFKADFVDSGLQCPGDTISFKDMSSASLKPITWWKWNFGDGDSSFFENPEHRFKTGGTYNVTLVSENIKDCIDTVLKQVLIQAFKPFAGNDTIIVKGESILFDATGGSFYSWLPSTNLSDSLVYNPIGYYPDTGQYVYVVRVNTEFGCSGTDTIMVTVVNQAEFFVPTAFSPNGDGINDFFKPIAVGYKTINNFFVFNRWGQRVYTGNSFEEGWDGTFKGEKQEIGTYFWQISFTDRFGKPGFLKGDVTLVR